MRQNKFPYKPKILIRPENTRNLRRFLIVCEGEKTEPNYFKKISDNIEVYGTGYNIINK